MASQDDIEFALANTEVLLAPRRAVETFGSSVVHYVLVCEKMDDPGTTVIREGKIHTERPQLITPAYYERLMIEGFGNEAKSYVDWLTSTYRDLHFLKYGFCFKKEELHRSFSQDPVAAVAERVRSAPEIANDPLSAIIKGVDQPWEVCLLKFTTDLLRHSVPHNLQDLARQRKLELVNGVPRAVREEIQDMIDRPHHDRASLRVLADKLKAYGLFESYEDEFFGLVRKFSKS